VRLPGQQPRPLAGQAIAAVMRCTRGQPSTVKAEAAGLTEPAAAQPDGGPRRGSARRRYADHRGRGRRCPVVLRWSA
jgi:hypothetical protein